VPDFENRLRDHERRRLAANQRASEEADAESAQLRRLKNPDRERAMLLVLEVYQAIAELRLRHRESYAALKYKHSDFPRIRVFREERGWRGGFKRLEWAIGWLTIPLRGDPRVSVPQRPEGISLEEFAEVTYYEWYSNSEVYGKKLEAVSANQELERVLDVLAEHIASL
jgi:hypothetical protein